MPDKSVIVLGAGAVGIAAAWQLRRRGFAVTLIDRRPPASETSHGNAGIVSESSAVPLNTPALRRQLARLLCTDNPTLHWRASYVAAQLPWCLRFCREMTAHSTRRRAGHLQRLITRGKQLHREWLALADKTAHIRTGGWLKLYRSRRSYQAAADERALWQALSIPYRELNADDIHALMPTATTVFPQAALVTDAFAICDPSAVLRAYADLFAADGGTLRQGEAVALAANDGGGWRVRLGDGDECKATHVVAALGPWLDTLLRPLGLRLPLALERGAHRHFQISGDAPPLPFTDLDGGYSAVMQRDSLRLTTGVYFAAMEAPPQRRQLAAAERHLRTAINGVGDAIGDDWYGARPTLPDCLPAIGATRRANLWLAGGCQHIGLMASPALGECVAQLISGENPTVDAAAFSPRRLGV